MRIKNLPSISSMDGSQDALVIEQTDGSEDKSRKVSPAQIKQYVLGNSIDDIYSVMGQMGAKNLIPYPYHETTHEDHGITWTLNSDGTVTANGTATANSLFILSNRLSVTNLTNSLIEGETYILSGCPAGGSDAKYDIFINETYNGGAVGLANDYGNGATFTLIHKTENNYGVAIRIRSGQAVSNLTFKPMLRYASDTDNTYQPYAKTNKELTDEIGDLSQTGLTGDSVAEQLGVVDTTKIKTVKLNKNQSATISANVRDYWAMMAVCYIPGDGGRLLGFVYTNGTGEVKNLWTGNAFSSSYVDFTFSSTGLTVTAKNYNGYVFSFIVTPPAAS